MLIELILDRLKTTYMMKYEYLHKDDSNPGPDSYFDDEFKGI